MARFHINAKGEPGPCAAKAGNCPFGGVEDHYDSAEEARAAFESINETFTVIFKKNDSTPEREVKSFDARLESSLEALQADYDSSADKNEWVNNHVQKVGAAQAALIMTLPGTPEREAALEARTEAREELLAADLVAWRSSEFYAENVEERMKENTVRITDADVSIEKALADENGKASLASNYGLSTRDVEGILEAAHNDYLRPRSPLSTSIADLSESPAYTSSVAYVFRVKPEAVQGVLAYASNYSNVPKTERNSREFDSLDLF